MVVRNSGTVAVNSWTVNWTFPSGQTVSQIWSATHTQSGASVTARPLSWNAAIPTGQTVNFGFLGTGAATVPATVSCTAA